MILNDFILKLRDMQKTKHSFFDIVKYPVIFFDALDELNKMVGMANVKNDIVEAVKVSMINGKNYTKNRLLHTMLLGTPGTGKTNLGMILCKIYTSLDMIKKPEKLPPDGEEDMNEMMRNKRLCPEDRFIIDQLKEQILLKDNRMLKIDESLQKHQNYTAKMFTQLRDYRNRLLSCNMDIQHVDYYTSEIRTLKYQIESVIEIKNAPLLPILSPLPELIYKTGSRADLVGKYLGSTAIKTRKFLNSAMGGVAFIDEAYELFQSGYSDSDAYGGEALTVIIEYMTKYNENIIIIFGGYEDAMKNTILKGQEGLASRIGYTYNIKPYTIAELVQIFKLQLKRNHWEIICNDEELVTLFKEYENIIINGRDTQKLVSKCIDAHGSISFELIMEGKPISFLLDGKVISLGLTKLNNHSKELSKQKDEIPSGMYC